MDSDSETEIFEDALDDLKKSNLPQDSTKMRNTGSNQTEKLNSDDEFKVLKDQDFDSDDHEYFVEEGDSSHTGKVDTHISQTLQGNEQNDGDSLEKVTEGSALSKDMADLSKKLIGIDLENSVENIALTEETTAKVLKFDEDEAEKTKLRSSGSSYCDTVNDNLHGTKNLSSHLCDERDTVGSDKMAEQSTDCISCEKEAGTSGQFGEDNGARAEGEISAERVAGEEDVAIEEELMKQQEESMSEEEKQERKEEAQTIKSDGNSRFKEADYKGAIDLYTQALLTCPTCYGKERSIMYSNRAACRFKLEDFELVVTDCSKALELNPNYLKALLRRAECHEKLEKLEDALEDYQKALSMDPSLMNAREACMRLPDQIKDRNEKMKTEMLGKLKELGNMVLKPFGLSTNNFQLQQDPNTGSYSVNFQQKAGAPES